MPTRLLRAVSILSMAFVLGGCVSNTRFNTTTWPKPAIEYTHVNTPAEADKLVSQWVATPGRAWGRALGSGSMRPYIHGGPREYLLYDKYVGQPLFPGFVVVYGRQHTVVQYDSMGILIAYYRQPEWLAQDTIHMVLDVSVDGRSMLVDGTNNRDSDGWQPVDATRNILRRIITLPALPRYR